MIMSMRTFIMFDNVTTNLRALSMMLFLNKTIYYMS